MHRIKVMRLDTGNVTFGQLASNGGLEMNLQIADEKEMRENVARITEDQKR